MGMPRSQNRSDSDENRENSPNLIRLCLDFGHSSAYLPLRYDSGSYFHEIGYWTNSCEPIGPCPPSEYFLSTCKVFALRARCFFFFCLSSRSHAGVAPVQLGAAQKLHSDSTPANRFFQKLHSDSTPANRFFQKLRLHSDSALSPDAPSEYSGVEYSSGLLRSCVRSRRRRPSKCLCQS